MRRIGFSLVEVVLALGVVATAVIGVFGLLPVGMNVFREAQNTSITAGIAQRVINDLQQTDFGSLGNPPNRYFDAQGAELDSSQSQKALYQTLTQVTTPVTINGRASTNLAKIIVNVAQNPGGSALTLNTAGIISPTPGVTVSTYSGWVSNNG